jgi:hypothetical protein
MILRLDLDEAGVARQALQVLKRAYRKEAELIAPRDRSFTRIVQGCVSRLLRG